MGETWRYDTIKLAWHARHNWTKEPTTGAWPGMPPENGIACALTPRTSAFVCTVHGTTRGMSACNCPKPGITTPMRAGPYRLVSVAMYNYLRRDDVLGPDYPITGDLVRAVSDATLLDRLCPGTLRCLNGYHHVARDEGVVVRTVVAHARMKWPADAADLSDATLSILRTRFSVHRMIPGTMLESLVPRFRR